MRSRVVPALVLAFLVMGASAALAQLDNLIVQPDKLVRVTTTPVEIQAGGRAEATLTLEIEPGWHVNANPPALDYLIPTEVELQGGFGVTVGKPIYPPPHRQKLAFEETELLVYDGQSVVRLPLVAKAQAVNGTHVLKGKVRFQSCNDQVCLAPASVKFELPVTVSGGVPPGAAQSEDPAGSALPPSGEDADSSASPPGTDAGLLPPSAGQREGFATGPPPGGAGSSTINNPIAQLFARGSLVAFLSLFFIGLALNLTPCVYPMLGVTVSIFGARRAAPPLQVFSLALVYVLGIAMMYSTLGLVAAFTGGLFGGFLQSPLVLVGIGVLLVALSLSMFGLYELQMPPQLLSKLGGTGTTSVAGIFASGLVVGIFAAPCIGPPVVALLALVGAKGDPWFGFWSFFVLSLGLGAPYLVLGTFSNLLQRLPRSGEWMVWVKKVFGVILLSVGLFYALLALAPDWAAWVMPAALILGGLYLGFFEKSASGRPVFQRLKWTTGALALMGGLAVILTTPREGIAFREFSADDLRATLAEGTPVMLDFSADWCLPCRELEHKTFTDRRVIQAARPFRTFKVDLTHFDSPESERWRKHYGINGVPTVVFLAPDGSEVRAARVEGFVGPEGFLERLQLATAAGAQAGL